MRGLGLVGVALVGCMHVCVCARLCLCVCLYACVNRERWPLERVRNAQSKLRCEPIVRFRQ